MLILVRKAGQNLVINDNIIVKILEVKKDQVKIGIVAPKEISVHRQEVFEMIKEANRNAAVKKSQITKNSNTTTKVKTANLAVAVFLLPTFMIVICFTR